MIYDCFTFWNEFDLLEIRLNELKDVVDQFVICESNVTFVGNPKPLLLSQRLSEFKDFNIKLLVFEGKTNPSSAWENEEGQRNFLINGLTQCYSNDVVLISDVDEIPTTNAVSILPYFHEIVSLEMSVAAYFMNNLHREIKWIHPKALKFHQINQPLNSIRLGGFSQIIPMAGHHASYLGGTEAIKNKIKNFSHQELNQDFFLDNVDISFENNQSFFGEKIHLCPVDPLKIKTLPQYVLKNMKKYKNHFIEF